MSHLLRAHFNQRKLTTLVENRTTYNAEYAELNIFETHELAEKVSLRFDFPVIASMLSGKKIMHLEGMPSFDFYPGESVVMPSNKEMVIDFPEATNASPTRCLALGIDTSKIKDVVMDFNESVAIENENNHWNLDANASHLDNHLDVDHLLSRMVYTFTNNNRSKDVLLDLMIQELIVRLLQTKAKSIILGDSDHGLNDTRIGYVIKYIREHLTDKDMSVEMLAQKACMSASNFHKKFKNTLGISPIEYINGEKIKFAKRLIKEKKGYQMAEIALLSGFNNTSYFNRQFRKSEHMTPLKFKQSVWGR